MADIIYAQPQGQGFPWGTLVLGLGILAAGYVVLKSGVLGTLASGLGTSLSGTPSQGTNLGPALGPVTQNGGQLSAGQAVANQVDYDYLNRLASAMVKASGQPATIAPVGQSAGVFGVAGPSTPTNFFPGGNNLVTSSRDLTASEVALVARNLVIGQASEGITNAWWQPERISNPGNWGINSQGSPQSNIPSGTRHCQCNAALRAAGTCGPRDDWYYC